MGSLYTADFEKKFFGHGAKLGYVISENYENADSKGKYNPEKMFSCLADSVILMLGGKIK